MELAYLFECHFNDGTILFQSQDDISSINPLKSAFYDVLQRFEDVKLFGLINDEHTYVVYLEDGHFEIDGIPFSIQGKEQLSTKDCIFRLIYFRRNSHSFVLGESGSTHDVEYHLGWQTTIDGKNYQQTVAIR